MKDPTAKPLPAPAGHDDEGLLAQDGLQVPWFDNTQQPADVVYIADGRTVALARAPGGYPRPSVYGTSEQGLTVRKVGPDRAAFVSGHWLTPTGSPEGTLLAQALASHLPRVPPTQLRIDDRPLLGAGEADDVAGPDHWSVAILGELNVPGMAEALPLRPTRAAWQDGILRLSEPGAPGAISGAGTLTLVLQLASAEAFAAPATIDVQMPVALLLDERSDGAWECPSPLWLPTTTGLLRVEQGGARTVPYLLANESRSVDLHGQLPAAGAGARVRLLLDQSGPKSLAIERLGSAFTLTLEVAAPALVFVLPGLAVDGAALPAPGLPPGTEALARAAALQLVPLHLCGLASSPWSLAAGKALQLSWQAGQPAATVRHFTAHGNWVLPPEAAANDAAGVSMLRALVPLQPRGDTQRFLMRREANAGRSGATLVLEPLDPFGLQDPAEALRWGPLATFGAVPGQEWWPGGQPGPAPEPAALRALYRLLPAALAQDGAAAGFAATRVRAGRPVPFEDGQAIPTTDLAVGETWAYRHDKADPWRRTDDVFEWPGKHFGWTPGSHFMAPAAFSATPQALHPALAWGEVRRENDAYLPQRWMRLSDGALLPVPAGAGVPLASWLEAVAALAVPVDADLVNATLEEEPGHGDWGLAKLTLVERLVGNERTLALHVGTTVLPIGPLAGKFQGVNRFVFAHAGRIGVDAILANGIRVATLDRVYLELERRGERFVVATGMLGWGAAGAFGWERRAESELHVTERFERTDGRLVRSVELNGILSHVLHGGSSRLDVYFWDTLLRQDADSIRVICDYRLDTPQGKVSICALQDALVDGARLDLSADIAILGTADAARSALLASPWQPQRRNLYSLLFDTTPDSFDYAGYLRIRASDAPALATPPTGDEIQPRIVPAWYLCDRDLVPWFDDSVHGKRDRAQWTVNGPLRSGAAARPGAQLDVTLYAVAGLQGGQCYACTLIGVGGKDAGLPQWVPAPVRVPPPGGVAGDGVVAPPMFRLWLFNPGSRMVAEWPAPAPADVAAAMPQALQDAGDRLWRMGWTREAVLESPADGNEVTWQVIDSLLLNRGASLAWFGWPLSPGALYPDDPLPSSTQVPQTSCPLQSSFALQVEFEDDRPGQRRATLMHDSGHLFGWPEEAATPFRPLDGVAFRSAGLRVGVHHKLVCYGPATADVEVSTTPLDLAAPVTGQPLSVHGEWLVWRQDGVEFADDGPRAMPGNVLQYAWTPRCDTLRVSGAPSGTEWLSPSGWAPLPDNVALQVATQDRVSLRLPEGAAWGTLSLALVTVHEGVSPPSSTAHKTLFPPSGTRVAGVFDSQGILLAFGEERASYRPPAEVPEEGTMAWNRALGAVLPARLAARVERVLTVDVNGRVVESALVPAPVAGLPPGP